MTDPATTDHAPHPEPNRARVRRLLLGPLGFRFDRTSRCGKDPDRARAFLDRICDDLGYLDDAELRRMAEMLQAKGEGAARCFWPGFATFRGHAEAIHPRPIEDLPEIRSWFGSVEGPRARDQGTLVETYDFLTRHKRPPYLPGEREAIRAAADKAAADLDRIAKRRADGVFAPDRNTLDRDRRDWELWYLGRRAHADEILTMVQEKRAAKGGEG